MATNTPNMNLLLPTIGIDSGLVWEQDINANSGTLDGHTHAPGSGIQIDSPGIHLTFDFPLNGNNLTLARSVNFQSQISPLTGTAPDLGCLYVSGVDLYYNDKSGNQIRITSGASVNATSSGITSGTASASFVSSILTVIQSVGVAAPIDAASYILRYNGSYPTPSGNAIVLAAPAALSGTYQITFPASPPVATYPVLMTSTGVLGTGLLTNAQIDVGTILGSNIASSTITQTNMASNSIGTAQIIDANITSAKIQNNVSLPGSAVSADSKILVVANTNASANLVLVRGTVAATGTTPIGGEGWAVAHTVNTGLYVVSLSTNTGDSFPSVVVTPNTTANITAIVSGINSSNFTVRMVNPTNGALVDTSFCFILLGIRV